MPVKGSQSHQRTIGSSESGCAQPDTRMADDRAVRAKKRVTAFFMGLPLVFVVVAGTASAATNEQRSEKTDATGPNYAAIANVYSSRTMNLHTDFTVSDGWNPIGLEPE